MIFKRQGAPLENQNLFYYKKTSEMFNTNWTFSTHCGKLKEQTSLKIGDKKSVEPARHCMKELPACYLTPFFSFSRCLWNITYRIQCNQSITASDILITSKDSSSLCSCVLPSKSDAAPVQKFMVSSSRSFKGVELKTSMLRIAN